MVITEIGTMDVGSLLTDIRSAAYWALLSIHKDEKIFNLGVTRVFGAKQMLARAWRSKTRSLTLENGREHI